MSEHINPLLPGPSPVPPSRKQEPSFDAAQTREAFGASFRRGADTYAAVRPTYPAAVLAALNTVCSADNANSAGVPSSALPVVLDIGAGTGKLTEMLIHAASDSREGTSRKKFHVLAADPSPDMLRVLRQLPIPVWQATAERTALKENSVDAVYCAQTWHWVDAEAAAVELDRIVRPGGLVVLLWNTLDVTVPWVLRLSRIMHSGDVQRPGFVPAVCAPWQIAQRQELHWDHQLRAKQLIDLMHTRSYWLRANEKVRAKMSFNIEWYLYEHLGFQPEQLIALPYRTDAFVLRRPSSL